MQKSISVLKAARQAERKRIRNRLLKSRLKGTIKRFMRASTLDEKKALLPKVYSLLDKGVSKGIMHRNTAARKKRRLSLIIGKLEKE